MGGVISPSGQGTQKVADTGTAGFALQNATPAIQSWTAPNDGNAHSVQVIAQQHVTSAETGGVVQLSYTTPDGQNLSVNMFPGGGATGNASSSPARLVAPGSTVQVQQSSALTAGAATVWSQMWAS
jgi:hypothetical protein